jgi:filamentous hemagglutinin
MTLDVLENHFGASFGPTTTPADIALAMSYAGPGSRGIVFGDRGSGQVGHVFNVVNQKGVIRFLDGQTGKAASLQGYKGFQLLRTK